MSVALILKVNPKPYILAGEAGMFTWMRP